MWCIYYQWKLSAAADEKKAVSASVLRHLGRCAHCRQFAHHLTALNVQLHQEAAEWAVPETVSISKAANAATQLRTYHRPAHRWVYAAAACAAVLFVGAFLWGQWGTNRAYSLNPVTEFQRLWSELPISASQEQLHPAAVPQLINNYYYQELSNLAADTKSAATLASACLGVDWDTLALSYTDTSN
ncbi:MAG: hypothetical protein ABFD91_15085 [Anaerohalosphaeraceae bacterium]